MREIKFRGFSKNLIYNEWVYGDLVHYYTDEIYILPQNERYWDIPHDGDEIIKESIEQYTGLKDKDGKEIYEGDILELTYFDDSKNVMYVSYNDSAKFVLIEQVKNLSINMEFFDKENMEVIGNIYEDKELLRK